MTELQQFLISQSLLSSGSATGYYGALTTAAVQAWQSAHGIVSYGSPQETGWGAVGPRTIAALASCAGEPIATSQPAAPPIPSSSSCPVLTRTLSLGSSGPDVTELQQFFTTAYSNYPESDVTGYFGSITQSAAAEWQSEHSIVSSGTPATTGWGVVGPRTRAALAACASVNAMPETGGATTTASTISIPSMKPVATVSAQSTYTGSGGSAPSPTPTPVPSPNSISAPLPVPSQLCQGSTCISTAGAVLISATSSSGVRSDCKATDKARVLLGTIYIGIAAADPCQSLGSNPGSAPVQTWLASAAALGAWQILNPSTGAGYTESYTGDCNIAWATVTDTFLGVKYSFELSDSCSLIDYTPPLAGLSTVNYFLSQGLSLSTTALNRNPDPNAPALYSKLYTVCGTVNTAGGANDPSPAASGTDHNYIMPFVVDGDSETAPTQSNVMVFENGVPLGPAHSLHQNIRDFGDGRFSHWGSYLYLSASDNSNPITNGRTYTYGVPQGQACPALSFTPIELSGAAPGYATFQSHTQLVTSNQYGIFVSFLSNEAPETGGSFYGNLYQWSLDRSTDGGKTFASTYTSPLAYVRASTIDTDSSGNIFAVTIDDGPPGTDLNAGSATLEEFSPPNFSSPVVLATVPQIVGGDKFTMIYDPTRQQFYLAGMGDEPNQFAIVSNTGTVEKIEQLFSGGTSLEEYPLLAMDGSRLYFAWTTTPPNDEPVIYNGIHFIYSDDGGLTWYTPQGTALTPPFPADDSGPVADIVPAQYAGVDSTWLSNFTVYNGVAQFMFSIGAPNWPGEMYERTTMSPYSTTDLQNSTWGAYGDHINALDGFFTRDPNDASTIYAIGEDSDEQNSQGAAPIIVMKSADNGLTWTEYAKSSQLYNVYAMNGARWVSGYGIVGEFTNAINNFSALNAQQVYFINVPTI